MDKLNILVLHRLGNPEIAPLFLRRHVFVLKEHFPEHNYIYHDSELPLPDCVRHGEFDAIVLDVTFLCLRWADKAVFRQINGSRYQIVHRRKSRRPQHLIVDDAEILEMGVAVA